MGRLLHSIKNVFQAIFLYTQHLLPTFGFEPRISQIGRSNANNLAVNVRYAVILLLRIVSWVGSYEYGI
jgi:hypothetical protein